MDLIQLIGWTGVGMLEFKLDKIGPVLMELNGRFFGSIDLSVKSNLNLPKQFLEMDLNGQIPPANLPFSIGTRVRNLHDEVLLNGSKLFKGKFLQYLKWKIGLVRSLLKRNEFIEDNVFEDPGFVLGQYGADFVRICRSISRKLHKRFLSTENKILRKDDFTQGKLAFVCKGNICRSPFAAAYLLSLDPRLPVHSFGTYSQENRFSPMYALEAAKIFNIQLQDHRSEFLTREKLSQINLFVVMDKENYFNLLSRGIPAKKIRFLNSREIKDPYKKDYQYFVDTYTTIKNSIDRALLK